MTLGANPINSSPQSMTSISTDTAEKPLALVVFLENVGHINGVDLPAWVRRIIDYGTEEYAKILLRLQGAYRRYDRVVILEDEAANGPALTQALIDCSRTHRVDVLLLVHGYEGQLVGHLGEVLVGPETFLPLLAAYKQDPALLDLRAVYGLNCHGATLGPIWLALGAEVANGAIGVNWFPEPSLSVFLWKWLRGKPYSEAVLSGNRTANRVWSPILGNRRGRTVHPWIASSRQVVFGHRDISIDSPRPPSTMV